MSLMCPVGPTGNLLDVSPQHSSRLVIKHPVLSLSEMAAIRGTGHRGWKSKVIDATFAAHSGDASMKDALDRICREAEAAVTKGGFPVLVLSDAKAGPDRFPLPSLIALGAVQQHLVKAKKRHLVALISEAGDAREVHDFATLVGYGADAVCPYVAYEALAKLNASGAVNAFAAMNDTSGKPGAADKAWDDEELFKNYRYAIGNGLLKVMSKMGISTLQSYKGAQIFEAVGLSADIIDKCFTGTISRIKGTDFSALYTDVSRLHADAFPSHTTTVPLIGNRGDYHFRNGGEDHFNSPTAITLLQQAARTNSREAYDKYAEATDAIAAKCTLRGLLRFRTDLQPPVPLEEVEPVSEIMKRFCTGAMSLGSISTETHEALAVAMNKLGGKSNTGEGGEDPARFKPQPDGSSRRSAIKQIASGRFGVTSEYLANADELQIKMAQGAKPGEGGELPGSKVSKEIGAVRHTTPGVGLISPPPHHDIYSIEDLAQLIHDLKNANTRARISVKLVSEAGVGVVAAGVAKAKAEHITVSGYDGGTGAAAWTGIKHAGLPWELGLAETQQTLVLNDLRSRVTLQTDGQLKTGRDVVVGALLGAEEFGFATAPLIALGCIMMRKCHLNTCPVGVATQDPLLRKKFTGTPEHVMNFLWLLAEDVRRHMAALGFRRVADMVGRCDMMEVNADAVNYKSRHLDLSPILLPAASLNPGVGTMKTAGHDQDHGLEAALDKTIIARAAPALSGSGAKVHMEFPVTNLNRSVGAMLSCEVSRKFGGAGLPPGSINIKLRGHAGQSLGFVLAPGVSIDVEGDANDYVGKGLSGGELAVYPAPGVVEAGFAAEANTIVGNVALYGATKGNAFFRGKAGERFAVRNSGATTVVEGCGDHGCEYMTGGRVVVLGATGRNFAAGMSGGIAYIHDPSAVFPSLCNTEMVDLEPVVAAEDAQELRAVIEMHAARTGSPVAAALLADWAAAQRQFVKVMPHDYKRVLREQALARQALAALAAAQAARTARASA
jgi:glutamate synthase domain-containing protein 2/glutamate synthase domain-containing protein 3